MECHLAMAASYIRTIHDNTKQCVGIGASKCSKEQILILSLSNKGNTTQLKCATRSVFFVSMAESNGDKTLRKIADAFSALATVVPDSQSGAEVKVEVAPFSQACSLVSPLFGCLGIAFKFAEMDYVAKVKDLAEASKSIQTLQSMIDLDVQANSVRNAGSHTRNLLRVKRGLDMVRILFEQIVVTEGNSLRDPASKAYEQVFAPYHGWAIRKAVSAGMYALPTKEQLLKKLNEDEASAKVQMQKYASASATLIQYIDKLFISRELGIDW